MTRPSKGFRRKRKSLSVIQRETASVSNTWDDSANAKKRHRTQGIEHKCKAEKYQAKFRNRNVMET